jgi:hypothetical protein
VSSIGDRAGERLSHGHVVTGALAQAQRLAQPDAVFRILAWVAE